MVFSGKRKDRMKLSLPPKLMVFSGKRKDRMKLSLPPKLMVFWVSSPVECKRTFLQVFFFWISSCVLPNSGFWCCVFLTLRITLIFQDFDDKQESFEELNKFCAAKSGRPFVGSSILQNLDKLSSYFFNILFWELILPNLKFKFQGFGSNSSLHLHLFVFRDYHSTHSNMITIFLLLPTVLWDPTLHLRGLLLYWFKHDYNLVICCEKETRKEKERVNRVGCVCVCVFFSSNGDCIGHQ